MTISAAEQYMIELINRARLNPEAEAARYDLPLNADLPAGTIGTAALEVLAPNTNLEAAAQAHSQWMLDNNIFSHDGAIVTYDDGRVEASDPGYRIVEAGYVLAGSWAWRENLAWSGTTGTLDLEGAIDVHHAGLYRSEGHRENTFAERIREIGIAQVRGDFTDQGENQTYDSSMLTLNFARTGTDHFVTGVAYTDLNNDGFYGIGEGRSGLEFIVNGTSTTVAAAGGYGIAHTPDPVADVTIREGGALLANLSIDTSNGNVKVDVVTDSAGASYLALAGDASLVSGAITDATLLGVADLMLVGSSDDNELIGNEGSNIIYGVAGDDVLRGGQGRDMQWDTLAVPASASHDDTLYGGDGDDRLHGQSGSDILSGGAGDDRLTGGGGRDTFIFDSGSDVVRDFTANVDVVHLESAALGLATDATVQDVLALGTIEGGHAVFEFGGGNVLRINGVDDLSSLAADLILL